MTIADDIRNALRDYKTVTPTYPLGDPSSPVWNPPKKTLRDALVPLGASADTLGQAAASAELARTQAELAAIAAGAPIYESIATGLAGTVNGDIFLVIDEPGLKAYRNDAGAATFLGKIGEKDSVSNYADITGSTHTFAISDLGANFNEAVAVFARLTVPVGLFVTLQIGEADYTRTEQITCDFVDGERKQIVGVQSTVDFTSVHSVTGSAGAWSVTYNVADATGITTSHDLRVAATQGREVSVVAGRATSTSGASALTGINTDFTDRYSGFRHRFYDDGTTYFDWDVLVDNNIYPVDNGAGLTTTNLPLDAVTLTTSPSNSIIMRGAQGLASTGGSRGTGTIALTAGSTTVAGTSTAFTTELNAGDLVYYSEGRVLRVASIASDTEFTALWAPEASTSARRFLIASAHELHRGAFEITAVDLANNRITVLNKSKSTVPPPKIGLQDVVLRAMKTRIVFPVDEPGLTVVGNAHGGNWNDIALVGGGGTASQTAYGVNLGRDAGDNFNVINGLGLIHFGTVMTIRGFAGAAVSAVRGAHAMVEFLHAGDCGGPGLAASDNASIAARRSAINGCTRGAFAFNGGVIQAEDSFFVGCSRGVQTTADGVVFCTGSAAIGSTDFGAYSEGALEFDNGRVQWCGSDGVAVERGKADCDNLVTQGNNGNGASVNGYGNLASTRIAACGNNGDGILANLGDVSGSFVTITGNQSDGLQAGNASRVVLTLAILGYNKTYGVLAVAGHGARVAIPSGVFPGNGTSAVNITTNTLTASGEYVRT